MIPRVARLGTGFSGAGLYYLHDQRSDNRSADLSSQDHIRPAAGDYMLRDKKGLMTSYRVGFTATLNLPTTDPEKALRCMSWLAGNAQSVRQAAVGAAAKVAGMSYADYVRKTNPYRGRKGQKPVYTLSIAWHPTKNKKPSKRDMLQAADEVLKVLNLEDRQALIVEHTDTKHPHIHLIINRVSPVNGKYASVGNDYLKLSKWALDYERRTGLVLCHERMFRWRERDKQRLAKQEKRRSNPKAKGRYVRGRGIPRRDHQWFKKHAHLPADEIRAARADRQGKEVQKFAIKQASSLLRFDQKLTRTIGPDLDKLKAEIVKMEQRDTSNPVRARNPKGSPLSIMRKMGDILTVRHFLDGRALSRMRRSADGLGQMMDARRADKRKQLGKYWKAMEVRHAAERRRDEERISRIKSKGRIETAGERSRKQFNIRGDEKTAQYTTAKPPLRSLKRDHSHIAKIKKKSKPSRQTYRRSHKSKAIDTGLFAVLAEGLQLVSGSKKYAHRLASKGKPADTGVFGILAEGLQLILGSKKSTTQNKQASGVLVGPELRISAEQKVTVKKEPRQLSNQPEIGQLNTSDETAIQQAEKNNQHTTVSLEGGDEYEARVASLLVDLERREKKRRRRRKRKRPRGKVHRME